MFKLLLGAPELSLQNLTFPFTDSPYGDVSGLPDPYTGHDISDELRQQSLDMHGLEHDLSAAAPEGYTTPNRRVIREIIV